MGNGHGVELGEALWRWQLLVDEHGVDAFEVGEHHELFQRGVVADIAFSLGVGCPPFRRRKAEEGHVQQIGLVGVDGRGLLLG